MKMWESILDRAPIILDDNRRYDANTNSFVERRIDEQMQRHYDKWKDSDDPVISEAMADLKILIAKLKNKR